jgi:hypothetical protein
MDLCELYVTPHVAVDKKKEGKEYFRKKTGAGKIRQKAGLKTQRIGGNSARRFRAMTASHRSIYNH